MKRQIVREMNLVENIKELAGKEKKSGSKVVEELIRERLKSRKRRKLEKVAIHFKKLESLKGVVSLGGSALKDSEAIYGYGIEGIVNFDSDFDGYLKRIF